MKSLAVATPLAFVAFLATVGGAVGQVPNPTIPPGGIRVKLEAQNNSGENGTATLTQVGKDTLVVLAFPDTSMPAQPAHIHTGTCAKLDAAPKYPLNNIVNGQSTTTLKNLSLASLQNGNFAINVHKSTSDIKTYVACGNIPKR